MNIGNKYVNKMQNISAPEDAEILEAQDWTFPVRKAYGPGRLA